MDPEMIPWNGGDCPVHEDQLVEIWHPGGDLNRPSLLFRAGDLDWTHRLGAFREGKLQAGAILFFRLGASLKITIYSASNGISSCHFEQRGKAMDPRPLLEQAMAALQAELDGLDKCPAHSPDSEGDER